MTPEEQREVDRINAEHRASQTAPAATGPGMTRGALTALQQPRGMAGRVEDRWSVPTGPEAQIAARAAEKSAIQRGVPVPESVSTILRGEGMNRALASQGEKPIKKLSVPESMAALPGTEERQGAKGPIPYSGEVDRSARIWGANVVPSTYFTGGPDPRLSRALSAARNAAADRGDWESLNASYGPGGLRGDWQPADRDAYSLADQDIGSMTIPELVAAKLKDRRSAEKRKAREAVSMEQLRQKGALDIARLGASPEETAAKSAYYTAQAKLLGTQTGTAEAQLQEDKRKNALMTKLGDTEFQQKDPTGYARLLQYYKAMYAPKPADAAERAAYIAQGINPDTMQPLDFTEKKAAGGAIEGYAAGGQIPAYGAAPQQNPMLSQYGQYLSAASESGVAPVPFAEYMKLLESTRAQPDQTIGFQDGGEIPPGYSRPEDVDWGGVLSRGVRGMFRMGPKEPEAAPAGTPPVSTSVGETDPTANFWTLDPARRAEIEADVNKSRGYAKGGAIDVSGRKLEGPGTGTSDSIPAVIDGSRPAALSNGEFVIPAHVVRAKGTEFFDKLIASYADKGQGDGE